MFIGRKNELKIISEELKNEKKSAILVYGKRRIGKSTLFCQAAKSFEGIVVNHQCIKSSYKGNLDFLAKSVCRILDLPEIVFDDMSDLFEFIGKQRKKIFIIIDEYQYMKASLKTGEMDSIMQNIIDIMPSNIKLALCGSYISIMKELLVESNPLFGRFTSIIHLKEMDYLEAAKFMDGYSDMDKLKTFAIFGGSPYVLSNLNYSVSIEANIKKLLLPENSILATYIENVLLSEIKNSFDVRILELLGNGRKKYSELLNSLDMPDNGGLDKQLNYLLKMETILKIYPINKKNDKKKSFYEINDNLMRFYFAMIFGNVGLISLLGEDNYYKDYISNRIDTFVSLRFEDIVKQYFANQARIGKLEKIKNIGSFWYDNAIDKTNGQFDCVLEFDDYYEVIEVKFYDGPMTNAECNQEIKQVKSIKGFENIRVGFVCTGGFDNKEKGIRYVELDSLMSE